MRSVLICDSSSSTLDVLSNLIRTEGHKPAVAQDAPSALKILKKEKFDIAIISAEMGGSSNGIKLAEEIREQHEGTQVIVTTAVPSVEEALRCLRAGASEYFRKPLKISNLLASIKGDTESAETHADHRDRRPEDFLEDCLALVGPSPSIQTLRREVLRLAQTKNVRNIFLRGPDGAQMSHVCRLLHDMKKRPGDFFVMDCAGIDPKELTPKFVGDQAIYGKATGGSIVLEHIDCLPKDCQEALCEHLQDEEQPVTLFATSEEDIDELWGSGAISHALCYRLSLYTLDFPALPERSGDMADLVEWILKKSPKVQESHRSSLFGQRSLDALAKGKYPNDLDDLEEKVAKMANEGNEVA